MNAVKFYLKDGINQGFRIEEYDCNFDDRSRLVPSAVSVLNRWYRDGLISILDDNLKGISFVTEDKTIFEVIIGDLLKAYPNLKHFVKNEIKKES